MYHIAPFPPHLLDTIHSKLIERQREADKIPVSVTLQSLIEVIGRQDYTLSTQKRNAMYPDEMGEVAYFERSKSTFEESVIRLLEIRDDQIQMESGLREVVKNIVLMARSVICQRDDNHTEFYQQMMQTYASARSHLTQLPHLYFTGVISDDAAREYMGEIDAFIEGYADSKDAPFPMISQKGPFHGHESTTVLYRYGKTMDEYRDATDQLSRVQALMQTVQELGRVLFLIPHLGDEMDRYESLYWWMELSNRGEALFTNEIKC